VTHSLRSLDYPSVWQDIWVLGRTC
jgi:hypothetical protein